MDSGLCWGASEWEQTPDSCDNNARHRSTPVLPITFLTFGGNLRPERTTHTFLLLPPSPLLPDGFFKTEKFPPRRNGSDTADTISGTSAGKQPSGGKKRLPKSFQTVCFPRSTCPCGPAQTAHVAFKWNLKYGCRVVLNIATGLVFSCRADDDL